METYDYGKTILQEHINNAAKKEEELIMKCFKKQPGFVSIEESKHLIEVNKMIKDGNHVGTDYIFNGKRILTVYPPVFKEENWKFTATTTYLEYP